MSDNTPESKPSYGWAWALAFVICFLTATYAYLAVNAPEAAKDFGGFLGTAIAIILIALFLGFL